MCEQLQKLTSSKTLWTWNGTYQTLFNKAQSQIKEYVCMKFYNETKPLNLETNALGIGLGAGLLQIMDEAICPKDIAPDNTILRPIPFESKSLNSVEQRYSNIKRQVLDILFGLERFAITDL